MGCWSVLEAVDLGSEGRNCYGQRNTPADGDPQGWGLFGLDEAFVDELVLDQRDNVEVLLKFGK